MYIVFCLVFYRVNLADFKENMMYARTILVSCLRFPRKHCVYLLDVCKAYMYLFYKIEDYFDPVCVNIFSWKIVTGGRLKMTLQLCYWMQDERHYNSPTVLSDQCSQCMCK